MTRISLILLGLTLIVLQGCGGGGGGNERGGLCGVPGLQGTREADIPGRLRGCGIDNPVSVTRVAGVDLSQPSLMNCETARALDSWVRTGAKPAVGRRGGGIESLRVAAHYSCRTVNSRRGGRISEHGKGRAIDISAINLRNGETITVLRGWRNRDTSQILRRMYRRACGPFTTTLGPDSDRFHQDHFHFDTAQRGRYCR